MSSENKSNRSRLKIGEIEAEFEGSEEFVQHNTDKYFPDLVDAAKYLRKPDTIIYQEDKPKQLPLSMAPEVSDTDQSTDTTRTTQKHIDGKKSMVTPPDFPTFYRKKNPQSQWQEVLVIAYYYQNYEEYEYLSYKDLDEAYMRLARVGVDVPSNARQAVKFGCEQKYLYKPERANGKFALTDQGWHFVEKMTGLDTQVS